ncbi:formate/nitrite transporter family protein [Calothrix sp. CCY 0018]|uniref:formate/nitrite transporter family protein n=1 Tax=Calothrix sp. CCY 0018 TaxID=3103864 RepID=UPI0039C6CAA3
MSSNSEEKPDELSESRAKELELDESEQREVDELGRAKAIVIHEVIRLEGEHELQRPSLALAFSGLAAGLSMGFSLVAEGLIYSALPDESWRILIASFGYTVGFLIVILGRQQLFTEKTLTPILPLFNKFTAKKFGRVMRLWAIVLASNLIGGLIFAAIIGYTEIFSEDVRQGFTQIARKELQGGFGNLVLRGIFAGWLIALLTWLLPAVPSSRLSIIIIITYLVKLAGLAHIIAGSIAVFYLIVTGSITWGEYVGGFAIATLLGNIIGGVSFVAALNYGQIAPQNR